ncbi:MAG TPA: mannose-6-phosphate isomerase, class I, partial [Atopostipes sp.]|nr:mannose-6-phosphate isomerase, class I [Atopostipes sp.]
VEVKAGDFFYVPSGTIHALGSGVMVLETQQSSDTTYRLYDYDRVDDEGNLRELHIEQSIDVTTVPSEDNPVDPETKEVENGRLTTHVSNDFFSVYEWEIEGLTSFEQSSYYTLVSVIDGDGLLKVDDRTYPVEKGDHFILPNQVKNWELEGKLHMIASHP